MQHPVQRFSSECGKAHLFVENSMPLGELHDFLMDIKGAMVERMVLAHKQQQVEADAAKVEMRDDIPNE